MHPRIAALSARLTKLNNEESLYVDNFLELLQKLKEEHTQTLLTSIENFIDGLKKLTVEYARFQLTQELEILLREMRPRPKDGIVLMERGEGPNSSKFSISLDEAGSILQVSTLPVMVRNYLLAQPEYQAYSVTHRENKKLRDPQAHDDFYLQRYINVNLKGDQAVDACLLEALRLATTIQMNDNVAKRIDEINQNRYTIRNALPIAENLQKLLALLPSVFREAFFKRFPLENVILNKDKKGEKIIAIGKIVERGLLVSHSSYQIHSLPWEHLIHAGSTLIEKFTAFNRVLDSLRPALLEKIRRLITNIWINYPRKFLMERLQNKEIRSYIMGEVRNLGVEEARDNIVQILCDPAMEVKKAILLSSTNSVGSSLSSSPTGSLHSVVMRELATPQVPNESSSVHVTYRKGLYKSPSGEGSGESTPLPPTKLPKKKSPRPSV